MISLKVLRIGSVLKAAPRPPPALALPRRPGAAWTASSWCRCARCCGRSRSGAWPPSPARSERLASSTRTGIERTVFSRYVAPVVEELAQGGLDRLPHPTAAGGLPRRRRDPRLRGGRRLRPGREHRLPARARRPRACSSGSCAASAPRSCTARPRRSSRSSPRAWSTAGTRARSLDLLPGCSWSAVAIHSAYNHFLLPPLVTTVLLLALLPPLLILAFERSERATRDVAGAGLRHRRRAAAVDPLRRDRPRPASGATCRSLTSRFPGPVVADMLCLLRIHLELSDPGQGPAPRPGGRPVRGRRRRTCAPTSRSCATWRRRSAPPGFWP